MPIRRPRQPRRARACRRRQGAAVIRQVRQLEMNSRCSFSAQHLGSADRACAPAAPQLRSRMIAAGEAGAQSAVQGVPNAMQGFSQNRDQPIQIEAASLEMRDKKKEATFSGNVKVVQGDTTMTSKTLVVFYDSSARRRPPRQQPRRRPAQTAPMQSASPGPGGSSSITPAGGAGQRGRDPEGSGRDRRDRGVRHQDQSGHHARRRGADPGQERAARRPADGGHDDRRVAGRIRQRAGAGPVSVVRARAAPASPARRHRRRRHRRPISNKPK